MPIYTKRHSLLQRSAVPLDGRPAVSLAVVKWSKRPLFIFTLTAAVVYTLIHARTREAKGGPWMTKLPTAVAEHAVDHRQAAGRA